jgi:hypothetical protein
MRCRRTSLASAIASASQRLRLAEMELFQLERSEELLIQQGEEDGIIIVRRFDADPAAILGVVVARAHS